MIALSCAAASEKAGARPFLFFSAQIVFPVTSSLAVALLLFAPSMALGAGPGSFPRGSGFYFSLIKLILLVGAYFAWVRTCWWLNQDAHELNLPAALWNSLLLGCGILGWLVVWLFPWFIVGFLLLLALYLIPTLAYVNLRNNGVSPEERVLTVLHFRRLAEHYLRLRPASEAEGADDGVPVRFIGKSSSSGKDGASRVARAEESQGYKFALEMVYEASQLRATDIHMEPTKDEMSVRFRIDGILQPAAPFRRPVGDSVINIFKVLADLDITERRKPQDGSFSAQVEDHFVDFRVATAGSVIGEKLVMRILDRSKQIASLSELGMREQLHTHVRSLVTQPHGMFIVCGPTGAGKSTTLYACLNEIDRFQKNVITIENPVEYQMENVTQIEVNPKAGKTFASELRSILRQDPDVIYIGEIRDQETAEIACQAAQTGHMVLTTLHANDTATALGRLIDLGVQPFMIASAVSAVLGQRLVRLLCPECKIRYRPNPEMLRKANLPADKIKFFYRPPDQPEDEKASVCENCGGTGFQGRTGIFEMLTITDCIRDMIRDNPNLNAIKQEAVKNGMRYLQEDGLRQVIEGRTAIQELLRVCK